jgi:hypothetical protein
LQLEQKDGAVLYSHRRLSTRSLTTVFGTVELVRMGYSRPGAPGLFPIDKAAGLAGPVILLRTPAAPGCRWHPAKGPKWQRQEGATAPYRGGSARERYCSPECRRAAREWSCWKAHQRYRATAAGREHRQGQSRRYRERVRSRQQPTPEPAVPDARVITTVFFRSLLRSPRLLPGIRATAEIAAPTILFARVPAGHGTRPGTRTPVAPGQAAAFADSSRSPSQIIRAY